MTRAEDIICSFLDNERIWPPNLAPTHFRRALVQVLRRLPDDAYETVSERVSFVLEVPQINAVNVPFTRSYPPSPRGFEVRFDTIVIFHQALAYPHDALVGLLAHELAHSIVSEREYQADEQAADDLVQKWGFGHEIEALRSEQEKAATSSSKTKM